MKRRRYIAWMLMLISMVMLVASVLPHHHHREFLCLQHDVTECVCTCAAGCTCPECAEHHHATTAGGHQNCDAGCVTKFHSLTPDEGQNVLSPEYAFCSLLYALSDAWMSALQFSERSTAHYTYYLEKLHSTCLPHVKGLRAPPCVLA